MNSNTNMKAIILKGFSLINIQNNYKSYEETIKNITRLMKEGVCYKAGELDKISLYKLKRNPNTFIDEFVGTYLIIFDSFGGIKSINGL